MTSSGALSILIAEDSTPDIILFKEALRAAGIHAGLNVFADGEECASYLRTTEQAPPDLIVLDLNLPKVDGFDLIRVVRSDPRYDKVPIAILTSSAALKDKTLSLDLGANTFITKPSRLDEFVETIGSAVRAQLDRTDSGAALHLTWAPGGPKPPAGRRRRPPPCQRASVDTRRRSIVPRRKTTTWPRRETYRRAGQPASSPAELIQPLSDVSLP
jgi:two-component system, chemotaxis family, response regulator Rcp1